MGGVPPSPRLPARAAGERSLADFETGARVGLLAALALLVGALSAGVALGLLNLIGLFTQLLYDGRLGVRLVAPTTSHLHALSALVPVGGGLAVGAMAFWGSERIRGHGIPEAMETILVNGSKVEPRLAVLKPVSSAISIGSGGPFGAEGPIILTGGAVGSVLAQLLRLSAAERRTLLVAGACGGMAAVFGTPVAAALFGVELLAFEWRPRSAGPIALAVVVASVLRAAMAAHGLVRPAPLFPLGSHGSLGAVAVAGSGVVGIAGALLAWVLTQAVYGMEDAFARLPFHWAWWPAIGGAVVGLGGLVDARALGVGYDTIGAELAGRLGLAALAVLLVVKGVIWSVALGSGTSGGILAPLLMLGAAMGGLLAPVLPGGDVATWSLLGMAATLAGVTRSPFTAVAFAFELTRDTGSLLALLLACMVAHVVSSGVLKRSILTEKVARRGFHVVREYGVDPLEALFVREVMATEVLVLRPDQLATAALDALARRPEARRQRLFPVVDGRGSLRGAVGASRLLEAARSSGGSPRVSEVMVRHVVVAFPDETLRRAADRMAEHGVGALVVLQRRTGELAGVVTAIDLLKARQRLLVEERRRERVLTVRDALGAGRRRRSRRHRARAAVGRAAGVDRAGRRAGGSPEAERKLPVHASDAGPTSGPPPGSESAPTVGLDERPPA